MAFGPPQYMKQIKSKDPYLKLLKNVRGMQHVSKMSVSSLSGKPMRREKVIAITEEDIRKQFEKQNGYSDFLGIKINIMDVFKKWYPLAPSVDRIDNNKDYYPDNIVINTRFENNGLNRCDKQYYDHIKEVLSNVKNKTIT